MGGTVALQVDGAAGPLAEAAAFPALSTPSSIFPILSASLPVCLSLADFISFSLLGPRSQNMAVSDGNSDFVGLGNGSVTTSAPTLGAVPPCDGDLTTQQLAAREALRTKVSPNGCLQVNGTVKSSFLPMDSHQRAPAMLSPCCHPCPFHRPLAGQSSHPEGRPEAGPATPSALASCCLQPHSEYSAPLCPSHTPVYQAACCLQPSPSFCLHHAWPGRFPHQPGQPHVASFR